MDFDIVLSVAVRFWKSFQTNGMCSKRHGVGRVRGMTAAEDRRIVLFTKRNRRSTSTEVANQFLVLAASASPEQLEQLETVIMLCASV